MELGHAAPYVLGPKTRSRAQEPAPPGIPNCRCSVTLADVPILGAVVQQRPSDAWQTLTIELSQGRSPQGQCW